MGLPIVCKTDHCSLQWLKEIQYVKGSLEKNALADALSRHPDPTSQPLDHLVPPFNMDIASFHGLTLLLLPYPSPPIVSALRTL